MKSFSIASPSWQQSLCRWRITRTLSGLLIIFKCSLLHRETHWGHIHSQMVSLSVWGSKSCHWLHISLAIALPFRYLCYLFGEATVPISWVYLRLLWLVWWHINQPEFDFCPVCFSFPLFSSSLLEVLALCRRRLRAVPHLHPLPGWCVDGINTLTGWNAQPSTFIDGEGKHTAIACSRKISKKVWLQHMPVFLGCWNL